MAASAATFDLIEEGRDRVLALKGDWTVETASTLDEGLRALGERLGPGAAIDVSQLGRIDVAGAYLIDRTIRGGSPCGNTDAPIDLRGSHAAAERLLNVARHSVQPCPVPPPRSWGVIALLDRIGHSIAQFWDESIATMSFFGETLAAIGRVIRHPSKIRWISVVNVMEHAGLNALPIIIVLNFFIGLVVAYLGARTLVDFGATVFTVELVSTAMMREFAVVITAVLLAGRTDSSFTAEIGAMKMRQEIDAMRVMGLHPMEALVVPRVFAMVVMTPLLTFAAVMAGLLGGLVACYTYLDVSPGMFFARVQENVPAQHFWVGMMKAPIFAFILAIVGCRHGLAVGGDVASLGKRVTSSVVQAIFLVIMVDAVFALWFVQVRL